jgi:hypothetical protein
MKAWYNYLLVVWRCLRIPLSIVMTLCLCVMCMGQLLSLDYCAYESRTKTPKQGHFRAVWIRKYCEGFMLKSGYTDTVVLRRIASDGPDTRIFVYEPSNGIDPPALAWLSPNELEISLRQVVRIYTQKSDALGIRIIYRIGGVDFP